MRIKAANIIACLVLFSMGGLLAGKFELEARRLEKKIRERQAFNQARIPEIEKQLAESSLSDEERKSLQNELGRCKHGFTGIPSYLPYNNRILGWPIGGFLMLSGLCCLFVRSGRKKKNPPA